MSYVEQLMEMDLPTLAYCIARGDMIKVTNVSMEYTVNDDMIKLDEDRTRRKHSYKLKKTYC